MILPASRVCLPALYAVVLRGWEVQRVRNNMVLIGAWSLFLGLSPKPWATEHPLPTAAHDVLGRTGE